MGYGLWKWHGEIKRWDCGGILSSTWRLSCGLVAYHLHVLVNCDLFPFCVWLCLTHFTLSCWCELYVVLLGTTHTRLDGPNWNSWYRSGSKFWSEQQILRYSFIQKFKPKKKKKFSSIHQFVFFLTVTNQKSIRFSRHKFFLGWGIFRLPLYRDERFTKKNGEKKLSVAKKKKEDFNKNINWILKSLHNLSSSLHSFHIFPCFVII